MRRLLIISHTPHFRQGNAIVGWGATVREIGYLARIFDSVCHIAPLHSGEPPANCLQYESPSVEFRPVAAAGGESLRDKLSILRSYPQYASIIGSELPKADVVHVRCPSNIGLLALAQLKMKATSAQLWVKYAGAWNGYPGEPLSYKLQRQWLLRSPGRAVVTVNGTWPAQPDHVRSFYNPCLTEAEIAEAADLERPNAELRPARLLFAGRLDADKGFPVFLQILRRMRDEGHEVRAEVVGDGPERARYEQQAVLDGTAESISFAGWRTREQMNEYYGRADFIVLPSRAEGWPKVLAEAMAYGAIPLASRVGSIAQYLSEFRTGRSLPELDPAPYCAAIAEYLADPALWRAESARARAAARRFTYDAYLKDVEALLGFSGARGVHAA